MHITTRNLIERADLSDSIRERIVRNSEFGAAVFSIASAATILALIVLSVIF